MAIRALIVDDEPLARVAIRNQLRAESDIAVIGEAPDGRSAIELVRQTVPDLLFLDIKMPGMDGFELLERLSSDHVPVVVFVTAHDRYAVKAFEVRALDYLLKPFTSKRFRQVLQRAREQIQLQSLDAPDAQQQLIQTLDERRRLGAARRAEDAAPERVAVRHQGRVVLIELADIDWIEASQNYVTLHLGQRSYLLRSTLGDFERRLDSRRFVRIHRSTVVNVTCIRDVISKGHTDYDVILNHGTVLRMSRHFRGRLFAGTPGRWTDDG